MTTIRTLACALLCACATASSAADEPAEPTRFPIRGFAVEGSTLVDAAELDRRLAPFVGEDRTIEDLDRAREAVRAAYRAAGRPMVSVGLPRSFAADGLISLKVVEIPLTAVRVTGNQRLSEERVRARLPSLREGESPAIDDIARQVALANDNPALALRVRFEPRDNATAGAVVEVTEQAPLSIAFTADNTGTEETGRWRAGFSITHADLLGFGDVATLAYVTAPENPAQVQQFAASYLWPLAALGDAVVLSASYSDTDAGRIADAFEVAGRGSAVGLRYQHVLVRSTARRHSIEIGIERRRYRNIVDFFGTDLGVDVGTRPLVLAYAFSGQRDRLRWAASVSYLHNLPGGARNDDDAYAEARFGADADWWAWRAGGRASLLLPGGFVGQLAGEGQYADAPLISGEQFGLGGARSVRGFDERALTGDRGWRLSAELATPELGPWGRLALFADRGGERRLASLPGEPASDTIGSWGLGWRFSRSRFSALLDWARVRDGAAATEAGEQKVHAYASVQF